jgi:hypothetical protein
VTTTISPSTEQPQAVKKDTSSALAPTTCIKTLHTQWPFVLGPAKTEYLRLPWKNCGVCDFILPYNSLEPDCPYLKEAMLAPEEEEIERIPLSSCHIHINQWIYSVMENENRYSYIVLLCMKDARFRSALKST